MSAAGGTSNCSMVRVIALLKLDEPELARSMSWFNSDHVLSRTNDSAKRSHFVSSR
ncbi:hypothetical protein CC1G_13836 [Coprinopsis cinerea okayama7|uniref:Uncharacterized protein n=1 Tax=Coprinopsis cinerea (strain Okayama-7 / 130 / ATCC MYA-4618 / FGSC 9003) TaxID=240176 RepID=D6RKJ8_COPC7|nr:hypothetical protein CC1G_13836 [Coprinopsis cinerea okayama7\|eukprot:XP_002911801.1 hypothetical protein CC1G_13836 [Coprinopsis cinerea okayama7\